MTLSLKTLPKWLFLPPAVALLMVLGPMSMQGAPTNAAAPAALPAPVATPAAASTEAPPTATDRVLGRTSPAVPRTPDLWQMGSALAAVLLLGAGGVMLLRKLRGGAVPVRGSAPLITLRQTLRLSPRQAVHAIEFDDRVLLIGEHERGLVLLDGSRPADRGDEAEVLGRPEIVEEDGAVPKNLVIPRPPQKAERPLPARRPASIAARSPGLNDFRALLQKVGRA